MNKQPLFFLILSLLFLFYGVFSINLIMQLTGIVLFLFLIYERIYTSKENKKYPIKNHSGKINFIGFLGKTDLILGILLLINLAYKIIPINLILFLVIILFLKALTFVWGGDIASMIDILSSVIIFSATIIEIPSFIIIGISIYLIQKGILSLFN